MLQFTANISQQCYNMESQYHTESCRPNTGKQTSNNKLTFTAKTPTWLNTKFNQSQQYQSFTLYKSIYSTPPSDICTVMQNKGDINRTLPCYTAYHNCTHWYAHTICAVLTRDCLGLAFGCFTLPWCRANVDENCSIFALNRLNLKAAVACSKGLQAAKLSSHEILQCLKEGCWLTQADLQKLKHFYAVLTTVIWFVLVFLYTFSQLFRV